MNPQMFENANHEELTDANLATYAEEVRCQWYPHRSELRHGRDSLVISTTMRTWKLQSTRFPWSADEDAAQRIALLFVSAFELADSHGTTLCPNTEAPNERFIWDYFDGRSDRDQIRSRTASCGRVIREDCEEFEGHVPGTGSYANSYRKLPGLIDELKNQGKWVEESHL